MLRTCLFSLLGHLLLGVLIFLAPSSREKVFIEEIPRSVRLLASLEPPMKPSQPSRKRQIPKPPPKPSPRKKAPPPPPPAKSKIQLPQKKPSPLLKPRTPPPPALLKDTLTQKLSSIEAKPLEVEKPDLSDVSVPSSEVPILPRPSPPPAPKVATHKQIMTLSDFPHSWYLTLLKEKIFSTWSPPSGFYLGSQNIAAVASVRVGRQGRLSGATLTERSGYQLFDKSVLTVLATVSDLPPLPKDYREDYLDVIIRFQSRTQ